VSGAAKPARRQHDPWDDPPPDARPLTRDEARALSARLRTVSPWKVVTLQGVVGLVVAFVVLAVGGGPRGFWSALYGAGVVVVPAVLMARGMTSKLSIMSPGAGAVSFMLWEFVKILVSIVMLAMAPRLVHDLNWPALLVGLVMCIKVYWLALLWQPGATGRSEGR
jgi:ATP synthase protein I